MIYATNATSQSVDVQIVDDTGLPVTGLVAATFPTVKYSLAGANADATVTLSDLAAVTTAWASGGLKERGEGVYRLDLPNAAFATAGQVRVRGETTNKRLLAAVLEVGVLVSPAAGSITDASFTLPSLVSPASGVVGFIYQLWRRFFKKVHKDGTTIKTFADDGTTIITTQTYTSATGVDDVGAAS